MTELRLVTSNQMEALADRLASVVGTPLANPLASEVIVVQSLGMARWLQLELARRNGICAHVRFPFPKTFMREICGRVVPEAAEEPPQASGDATWQLLGALTWRVWGALTARSGAADLAEPIGYAGGDPRRQFQLASRVAALFDQYLVYRPELIAAWNSGQDDHWQAALWRQCGGGPEAWTEARLLAAAATRMAAGPVEGLPERVSVFGISALPPVYLNLLAGLAAHVEVTLYQLQPCREFWADAVTSREEQRNLRRAGRRADEGGALHLERGHRLLTSLGRLGRSFVAQLAEHGAGAEEDPARVPFQDPGDDTLLHVVQSDILNLRDRTAVAMAASPLALRGEDASVRVHACHSPRRELEVLYDQILEAFDDDPTLTPRDVLVLTPDIESYAPLIQAVFGAPEEERLRLPFTVADRAPRAESPLADVFLRLLQLPGRRFGVSEVLPLLETPACQRRFGLNPPEVLRLRDWLTELRTSWGLDAAQRGELGLPELPQGTWRHGADRLLLGYAMAPDDEALFGGLSPFSAVEGDGAELAGRIAALVAALEEFPPSLTRERSLKDWATDLGLVLDRFFAADPDSEADFGFVRGVLGRLRAAGGETGFAGDVPLAAVVEQLGPWLGEERRAGGFLRGGVTFAALKPMRSVPARFIAVLGLNDTTFPRRANPLSFDLIASAPRSGDESREADDRYLFLETLLSARDRLHLSYVGQSLRDNARLPPSVVVSELLDYLADTVAGGADAVERHVVLRHPLHAFSPAYFGATGDPRLTSFSRENFGAARVAQGGPAAEAQGGAAFCAVPLGEPEGSWRTLDGETLAKFLVNPAKFFLEQRLGLRLPETSDVSGDREVFALDSLAAYQVKQAWLELARAGRPTAKLARRLAAEGALPLGPSADLAMRDVEATAANLLSRLSPEERAAEAPVPLELTLGGFTLAGQVAELTRAGLVRVRPAKFKPGELLRLWVSQLLRAAMQPGVPVTPARLVTEDEDWRLSAPADPRAVLADLLELYAAGLCRPLPFFPKAAWAFTEPVRSERKQPLDRALEAWAGAPFRPGEGADAAFSFCFGEVEPHPLDEEFERLAGRVLGPLRAAAVKAKGTR